MEKITLALTNYNRFDLTVASFKKVINDDRIEEIFILDDCSIDGSCEKLTELFRGNKKVYVAQQFSNRGMQQNKADAVVLSRTDWVILFDSDNEIDTDYIDAIEALGELKEDTIYSPSKALPTFDYHEFEGLTIDKTNVAQYVQVPFFGCLINTCNYLVHRGTYGKTFQFDPKIKGVDTANHFYNHIIAGGKFYVVPGMKYNHLVHPGSEFMVEVDYNMACAAEIDKKLLEL